MSELSKDDIIEVVREMIRERGFMGALELAVAITCMKHKENIKVSLDVVDLLEEICCADIHSVEYTNKEVLDYRVKDLFYFNPTTSKLELPKNIGIALGATAIGAQHKNKRKEYLDDEV